MTSPNLLGTFFETTPLDQAALVDLGDDKIGARFVSLSARVFPRDIFSVANNVEGGVNYDLIGSSDGKPASISIRGNEVSACSFAETRGAVFRISPNKQCFAGWAANSNNGSAPDSLIPTGFHAQFGGENDTLWVRVSAEGEDTCASQVLALTDGWFGGNAVLRPFICEVVTQRVSILQDPRHQSLPGAVTGIVEGGRVAVGNVFDLSRKNWSHAVIWEDRAPRPLHPDEKLVTSCLGCTVDGSVIWGSAGGQPTLWLNGQTKHVTDIHGRPFTGEVLWATESGFCGGTGHFMAIGSGQPRRTGWIARTDTQAAIPIDVYLREVGKMPIQERLLSVYQGRSFGNRLLLLVQTAPQFS